MKTLFALLLLAASAFVAWPYYHVWQLEQAVVADDRAAMSQLVDLISVREQIKRRLNKEVHSSVGDVSNAFVDWLQDGIRRMGASAVDNLVTLEWVRTQLLAKSPAAAGGFVDQISYAFFDAPDSFLLRIGELDADPVHVRLSLQGPSWRVTAVYN